MFRAIIVGLVLLSILGSVSLTGFTPASVSHASTSFSPFLAGDSGTDTENSVDSPHLVENQFEKAIPGTFAVDESDTETSAPYIVDLYPNPPTFGDAGEFVTVWFPEGSNLTRYELADDHVTVPLFEHVNTSPDVEKTDDTREDEKKTEGEIVTESTALTFSTETNLTASLTDRTVRPLSDRLRLADRGDRIRLLRDGRVVDEVS